MENNNDKLQIQQDKKLSTFTNMADFENAQRIAMSISKSNIVPKGFQNNIPNCIVALEMASRMGMSPIFVMQNLDIIHGKPSWRSTFIISALNTCGKFSPLRFEHIGEISDSKFSCRAYAKDLETNEVIYGPKITWTMAKAEGWIDKNGSKWKTMPELMFNYRAAAFFGRLYAPEILTGMHTVEENLDVYSQRNTQQVIDGKLELIKELFNEKLDKLSDDDKTHLDRIILNKEVMSYDKAIKRLKEL